MRSSAEPPVTATEGPDLVAQRLHEFNLAMGALGGASPYPALAEARRRHPITLDHTEDLPDGRTRGVYTAYSWDAVQRVLSDDFSSAIYREQMGLGGRFGRSILDLDDPEHREHRALIQPVFTRAEMARLEAEVVAPVVDDLLDRFASRGQAELVGELLFPFPSEVLAAIIGIPRSEVPRFQRLAIEINGPTVNWDRAIDASLTLSELVRPLIAERRSGPGDGTDLLSVLCRAQLHDRDLTHDEIFAFVRLLSPAGGDTPYRATANLVFALLNNPDQMQALRDDRSLTGQAIEEGVRWEAPLISILRLAVRDTDVCGMVIPAGSVIAVSLGAANHDERRWTDPERFDLWRDRKANVGFGAGVHACVGIHLARMSMAHTVGVLLDRLPNLRLDPEAPTPSIEGVVFRAPPRLDVVWDTP